MSGATHQPHYASASLYVGDLDPDVNELILYEVFSAIGPVASVRVCRESGTRRSLGYAYVNYQAISDAERSLDTLNYTPIKGVPCRIMWSHRDPALRRSGAGNIFVKNLDKIIDNKALHDTFSLFGNILSCKVATDEYGKSKGYGFVHYETDESALAAIEKVNGMQIGSKTVFVGPFKKQVDRPDSRNSHFTNVYVKQFPSTWTDETIKSVFGRFGEITSSVISTDVKGRRFGLVNFAENQAAKNAVEALHGRLTNADGVLPADAKAPEREETKGGSSEETVSTPAATGEKEKTEETKKTEESAVKKVDENTNEKTEEEKAEDAKAAAEKEAQDDRLYVVRAMPRAERVAMLKEAFTSNSSEGKSKQQGINLYVKNLDDEVNDEELRNVFSKFGTVTSAKVMRDEGGVSKGFGFVCFAFPEEATKAVTAMHLKIFHNKPLYVGLAERRDSRLARLKARYRMSNTRPNHPLVMPQHHQMVGRFDTAPVAAAPPVYYGPQMGGRGVPPSAQSFGGVLPAGADPTMWRQHPQRPFAPGPMNPLTPAYPYPMGMRGGQQQPGAQRMRNGMVPPQGQQNFKFTPQARNQQEFPSQQMHVAGEGNALSAQTLAGLHPQMQKQMLGERLFPLVNKRQPELAGKITGMMLEMDNAELLALLDSEALVQAKVDEALGVLHRHQQGGTAPTLISSAAAAPQTVGPAV